MILLASIPTPMKFHNIGVNLMLKMTLSYLWIQPMNFYRVPYANEFGPQRTGVYRGPLVDPLTGLASTAANAVNSILVGDLDGGTSCIDGIPNPTGQAPDAAFLASVIADPNCFSFIETIPNGFVPRGIFH